MTNYQEAIENSNIVSKTDINGIITFVNDEFCKLFGFSASELIGQNHNIVRHPDTPKENFEALWETILNKNVYKASVKNLTKDKKTVYLNTTITPILDENNEIFEFIAIRYDITEEMKLKEEFEKQQKLLFLQSRMASLGQMLANIAHQWRQPLMELNLTLFNMKKSFEKDKQKEFEEFYKDSKDLVSSMSKTIEDFSNFFTPQKQKESFLLNLAINDALKILNRSLEEENIDIIFDVLKDIEVFGVQNELVQVLINLIQNSKDAFNSNSVENRKITIKSYLEDEFIVLELLDNALGVPQDLENRIFEPYFTSKHQTSGTGLGLFICKVIVENSFDGQITHENIEKGSCFIIRFPKKGLL